MLCAAVLQPKVFPCKGQIRLICQVVIHRDWSTVSKPNRCSINCHSVISDLGHCAFGTAPDRSNMEKIYQEKNALREQMKTVLAGLTPEDKNRQSEVVKQKLFNHDVYKKSKRVSVFLNMDDEVHTLDILKDLLNKQKTVFIPRYSGKLGRMDMVKLDSWQDYENLPLTRWNIKQPAMNDPRENAFETGGLDLTIMPGLAFTKSGCRLGRGKGYYDAFLTRYATLPNGKPYSIAVAFTQQVLPSIPVTDKDVIINEVLFAE